MQLHIEFYQTESLKLKCQIFNIIANHIDNTTREQL